MTVQNLDEMTDDELKSAWNKGRKWLISIEDNNDINLYKAGLRRIEALETVMQNRRLQYGQN